MKVFIAGATGTLGRPVVRLLVSHGHEVAGLSRSGKGRELLEQMGASAVSGDALDADRLRSAVAAWQPQQVVHLLTALPPTGAFRPGQLRATNVLRTTGTANLLRAAVDAGARRVVAESFVAVYGSSPGAGRVSEDAPLPPIAHGALEEAIAALRSLEDQLRAARSSGSLETVTMRIGFLYGPDVPSTQQLAAQARARRLFVPRAMSGIGAFVHIGDAAAAIVAAIERPNPSAVYNVVDDEPVALDTFLSAMTQAIGAPPARHIPGWLLRIAAPVMAEAAAARLALSNAKAKRELGWSLRYPTIEAGLADLAQTTREAA
jgi:nucleoside-diphosphate-sugar epimerase